MRTASTTRSWRAWSLEPRPLPAPASGLFRPRIARGRLCLEGLPDDLNRPLRVLVVRRHDPRDVLVVLAADLLHVIKDLQAPLDLLFHPLLRPVPSEGDLLVDIRVAAVVERVVRGIPCVRRVRDQLTALRVRPDDLDEGLHAARHVRL